MLARASRPLFMYMIPLIPHIGALPSSGFEHRRKLLVHYYSTSRAARQEFSGEALRAAATDPQG